MAATSMKETAREYMEQFESHNRDEHAKFGFGWGDGVRYMRYNDDGSTTVVCDYEDDDDAFMVRDFPADYEYNTWEWHPVDCGYYDDYYMSLEELAIDRFGFCRELLENGIPLEDILA